jgi:hypothetical protein
MDLDADPLPVPLPVPDLGPWSSASPFPAAPSSTKLVSSAAISSPKTLEGVELAAITLSLLTELLASVLVYLLR